MRKILVMAVFCFLSVSTLFSQSNTRIPTTYMVNEYSGQLDFKQCTFTFDTVSNLISINMVNDSVFTGEFNGIIHFYNENDELMKDCKVVVSGDKSTNAYTTNKCGCVIPFILTQFGSIKIEVNINSGCTLMCIVLCDKFKI